jgi:beta-lactamase superfamily II metal-dependent hydrolase
VNPITWYQQAFPGQAPFRFILSHPDLDHLLGIGHVLSGALQATCVWDLNHTKQLSSDDFRGPEDRLHWDAYVKWRARAEPVPRRLALTPGADAHYYGQSYDRIEILSPTPARLAACNAASDWNDASYVLRVSHGGRSVLLPGDAGQAVWDELAEREDAGLLSLGADVLVASHHGRTSGYPGNGVLARIDPQAVLVSTDKVPRQHSAVPAYARYVGAGNCFSTRWHGNLAVRLTDLGTVAVYAASQRLAAYSG